MKKFIFVLFIFLLLFSPVSYSAEWNSITDQIEIDNKSNIVRIYAVVEQGKKNPMVALQEEARKILSDYITTLTCGNDERTLASEFKIRPQLKAKVQHLIQKKTRIHDKAFLPDTHQHSGYLDFDLYLLKKIIPDLNYPRPEGSI